MDPTIKNKWPQLNNSIYLLTLLLFSIYCNGQTKLSEPAINPGEHPTSPTVRQTTIYDNIHCGLQDKAGNLWFGTTGAGIYRYDGKTFTNYTTKDGLSNNNIWSMHEDKNGNILFGTDSGIIRYDARLIDGHGKSFTNITENSGIRNISIWSFCEDRNGTLWIATGDSGVYKYDGKSFSNFLSADVANISNLNLKYVSSIAEDKAGNIWFASWSNEGISRFDGKSLARIPYAESPIDYMVHCILEDKTGNLWFGTRNNGAFRYDGKSFINYREKEGFASRGISIMLEDKKGNIWFGTENKGVFCYDGNSFTNFTTEDGLSNNSVFSIVEDSEGYIWFGTRNVGLCRYDGISFIDFSDRLR